MSDDVKVPDMLSAMLTALGPALEPTGEHKVLPDGYCPDCCGAPCIREWLTPTDDRTPDQIDDDLDEMASGNFV